MDRRAGMLRHNAATCRAGAMFLTKPGYHDTLPCVGSGVRPRKRRPLSRTWPLWSCTRRFVGLRARTVAALRRCGWHDQEDVVCRSAHPRLVLAGTLAEDFNRPSWFGHAVTGNCSNLLYTRRCVAKRTRHAVLAARVRLDPGIGWTRLANLHRFCKRTSWPRFHSARWTRCARSTPLDPAAPNPGKVLHPVASTPVERIGGCFAGSFRRAGRHYPIQSSPTRSARSLAAGFILPRIEGLDALAGHDAPSAARTPAKPRLKLLRDCAARRETRVVTPPPPQGHSRCPAAGPVRPPQAGATLDFRTTPRSSQTLARSPAAIEISMRLAIPYISACSMLAWDDPAALSMQATLRVPAAHAGCRRSPNVPVPRCHRPLALHRAESNSTPVSTRPRVTHGHGPRVVSPPTNEHAAPPSRHPSEASTTYFCSSNDRDNVHIRGAPCRKT